MSVFDKFKTFQNAILDFFKSDDEKVKALNPIPEVGDTDLPSYIKTLFEDGQQFERDHFAATANLRPEYMSGGSTTQTPWTLMSTPEGMRRAADLLEAGNNFEVYGHRNTDRDINAYKQENPEGAIARAMRIRGTHIEGAWHDVTIMPNISGINEVFDEERKKCDWGHFTKMYSRTARKYGTSTRRLIVDWDGPEVVIRPITCVPGSVVRTPNSATYSAQDGCWYAIHADMVNDKQVQKYYPELDVTTLDAGFKPQDQSGKSLTFGATKQTYKSTDLFTRFQCFMDDDTLEWIPFTQDEQAKIMSDHAHIMGGSIKRDEQGNPVLDQNKQEIPEPLQAQKHENHREHIKQKQEAVSNLMQSMKDTPFESPEDEQKVTGVLDAYTQNIQQHMDMMNPDELTSMGLRQKYPNGRYICIVGGQVAQDGTEKKDQDGNVIPETDPTIPRGNPFGIPWRMMFRDLLNEEVVGRIDGRGDPEIMYHTEKNMSLQRSRIEELSLAAGVPKRFRHISDKTMKGVLGAGDNEDNDPFKTGYYAQVKPEFVQAHPPTEMFEMYKIDKDNSTRDLGANEVSTGERIPGDPSGRAINFLQAQNQVTLAGELDLNLREALEDTIEAMFELYKIFYIQARRYYINGENQLINVAQLLSKQPKRDQKGQILIGPDGQPVMEDIPKLEITVRPFSNFPNKWETEFGVFGQVAAMVDPATGGALIPSIGQALKDKLAEKFPEFGANGKYGQMDQVYLLGLQVMKQQQAQQEQQQNQQNMMQSVTDSFVKSKMREQMDSQNKGQGPEKINLTVNYADLDPTMREQVARQMGMTDDEAAIKEHEKSLKPTGGGNGKAATAAKG